MSEKNYESIMDSFVYDKLIKIFSKYPTSIQDTIMHIISIRLRELYASIDEYPGDVMNPSKDRYDMLLAKAKQFDYEVNSKYSLSEQIALLNSIYQIYSKRGSVDSIKNMWKYYGGNLPKDVTVEIPAYEIFRYSVSALSGTHHFQDNVSYRAGVYTINIDGYTDISDIRDFIINELVAAGTSVNFHKVNTMDFSSGNASMATDVVYKATTIYMDLMAALNRTGLTWSAHSPKFTWSGTLNLLISITVLMEVDLDDGQFVMEPDRGYKYDFVKKLLTTMIYPTDHYKATHLYKNIQALLYTMCYADPRIHTYMDILAKNIMPDRYWYSDHIKNIRYAELLLNDSVLSSNRYYINVELLGQYSTKVIRDLLMNMWLSKDGDQVDFDDWKFKTSDSIVNLVYNYFEEYMNTVKNTELYRNLEAYESSENVNKSTDLLRTLQASQYLDGEDWDAFVFLDRLDWMYNNFEEYMETIKDTQLDRFQEIQGSSEGVYSRLDFLQWLDTLDPFTLSADDTRVTKFVKDIFANHHTMETFNLGDLKESIAFAEVVCNIAYKNTNLLMRLVATIDNPEVPINTFLPDESYTVHNLDREADFDIPMSLTYNESRFIDILAYSLGDSFINRFLDQYIFPEVSETVNYSYNKVATLTWSPDYDDYSAGYLVVSAKLPHGETITGVSSIKVYDSTEKVWVTYEFTETSNSLNPSFGEFSPEGGWDSEVNLWYKPIGSTDYGKDILIGSSDAWMDNPPYAYIQVRTRYTYEDGYVLNGLLTTDIVEVTYSYKVSGTYTDDSVPLGAIIPDSLGFEKHMDNISIGNFEIPSEPYTSILNLNIAYSNLTANYASIDQRLNQLVALEELLNLMDPGVLDIRPLLIYYADDSSVDWVLKGAAYDKVINYLSYSSYGTYQYVEEHYYNRDQEELLPDDTYPGSFVLGKTLLGTTILRSSITS